MSEVLLYNGDCIQAMGGIADHYFDIAKKRIEGDRSE